MFKFNHNTETNTLEIGFGAPAANNDIVKFVEANAPAINGPLLKISGPASLPVAFVLAHKYLHACGTIAIFDPKLNGFVVVSSHGGAHQVGDLIPA